MSTTPATTPPGNTQQPLTVSNATLEALKSRVAVPNYDRAAMIPGIVHLGVGAFHRAHQARYLDALMQRGLALEWGIRGIGVLPQDHEVLNDLRAQDGLYTLVHKAFDGTRDSRVVGSLLEVLHAPQDPDAAIEAMADERIRIVTMTITEGGYNVDATTMRFNLQEPEVAADLQQTTPPRTVFALVAEALRRRRDRGLRPFTVVSCDNVLHNGDVARTAFTSYARALDESLGEWVEANVTFPNSMVDGIVPRTTAATITDVNEVDGIQDSRPVAGEPYVHWVIEDRFVDGRPPLEQAGVAVVDDVEPHELVKLRLLNAGHQALGYFGYLAGYRLVHEAAGDPLFAQFLLDYMEREASPTLTPIPGLDLAAHRKLLVQRFSNPNIRDTLARLCTDASDRIPTFLLPVVHDQLARGGEFHRAAAVVASWARYAEGRDDAGEAIVVDDRLVDVVISRAKDSDPLAFLRDPARFGDLAENQRFVQAYTWALTSLREHGARATLQALVEGVPHG